MGQCLFDQSCLSGRCHGDRCCDDHQYQHARAALLQGDARVSTASQAARPCLISSRNGGRAPAWLPGRNVLFACLAEERVCRSSVCACLASAFAAGKTVGVRSALRLQHLWQYETAGSIPCCQPWVNGNTQLANRLSWLSIPPLSVATRVVTYAGRASPCALDRQRSNLDPVAEIRRGNVSRCWQLVYVYESDDWVLGMRWCSPEEASCTCASRPESI